MIITLGMWIDILQTASIMLIIWQLRVIIRNVTWKDPDGKR